VSITRSRRLPLPSPDMVPRTRPPSSPVRGLLSFRRLSLLPLEDPPSLFRLPPLFGAGSERGASAGGLGGGSFRGASAGGLGGGSGLLSGGGSAGTGFVSWAHAIVGVKNARQN